jgi:hypothetical protein
MRKLYAIVGQMTFLEKDRDGEEAAILDFDRCQVVEVEDDDDSIEALLETWEAYLIPEQYNGAIRYL